MKLPFKLNPKFFKKFPSFILASSDPCLIYKSDSDSKSMAMRSIRLGGTFKTTYISRYINTINLLQSYCTTKTKILDIGASDGSASLSGIHGLSYSEYIVSDKHLFLHSIKLLGLYFIFTDRLKFQMAFNSFFVLYRSSWLAWFFRLFDFLYYNKAKRNSKKVSLLRDEVIAIDNVSVLEFDMFRPKNIQADVVIVANILNRSYFTDEALNSLVLYFLRDISRPGGIVALIDNRAEKGENSSILHNDGHAFTLLERVGDGSDVEHIFLNLESLN